MEVISTSEFSVVPIADRREEIGAWLRSLAKENCSAEDNPATLGLHMGPDGHYRASHFVGTVWIRSGDWQARLEVLPKQGGSLATAVAMTRACLSDGVVAQHLQRTLWFWPDEQLVPCGQSFTGLAFLTSAIFLRELYLLCKRDLRRGFATVRRSLCGRAKGRILLTETIRKNLVLGRPDKLICQFQVHEIDTVANRILRCALEKAQQHLHAQTFERPGVISEWVSAGRAALESVPVVRVERAHLALVNGHSAAASTYRLPLRWARRVLLLLGPDPGSESVGGITANVCPFAIDMNELFERYCEALLRRQFPGLKAFYSDENQGRWLRVRPDFVLPEKNAVLDAKYKYDWDGGRNADHRADVYQLLAYSRHRAVVNRFSGQPGSDFDLYILYPVPQPSMAGDHLRSALGRVEPMFTDDLSGVRFFRQRVCLPNP